MKESYKYIDGNVEIYDYDNGNNKTIIKREYQDNIDKILVIENIIEELEKEKAELISKHEIISKETAQQKFLLISTLITFLVMIIAAPRILFFDIVGIEKNIIHFIAALSAGAISYIFISNVWDIDEKINKINRGTKLKLEKIDEQLGHARRILKKLNKEKTKESENIIKQKKKPIKVTYKENLIQMRNYLNLYYKIGTNEPEFLEYYKQGILEQELEDEFSSTQLKLIKKHFDKKDQ